MEPQSSLPLPPPSIPKRQNYNLKEIPSNEITKGDNIGNGSFGMVYKAMWNTQYVALKEFSPLADKSSIDAETRQLSRINHRNIIGLYGICITESKVSLIMEFAECGSLYDLLHGKQQIVYKTVHAMSWALQCAEGVAYMHAMKPKPIIHRDLKPPNLLLFDEGRHLKICDFGTAVEKKTNLTNNKGSAPWMAPEVFGASNYTEKCDVFSWGIILWEILAREVPFKKLPHALSISWSIYHDGRPPKINDCPKAVEDLMTTCWDKLPSARPSMSQVVTIMKGLCELLNADVDPIDFNSAAEKSESDNDLNLSNSNSSTEHIYENVPTNSDHDLLNDNLDVRSFIYSTIPEENEISTGSFRSGNQDIDYLPSKRTEEEQRQRNEDIRNGMKKFQGQKLPLLSVHLDESPWQLKERHIHTVVHHIGAKSDGNENLRITETKPVSSASDDEEDETENLNTITGVSNISTNSGEDDTYSSMLEPELQPIKPTTNSESREIYEEHKSLAKEYFKVSEDLYFAEDKKRKILGAMNPEEKRQKEELLKKMKEKQELLELFNVLQQELTEACRQQEILELNESQANNPHDSQSEASDSNDESSWEFMPRLQS